jgi:outer membrane receptor for ferrienterochelin and colicins
MGFRAPGLDELYYNYFSVNHGKVMVTFGDKNLKPEKSNYVALNAEYRTNRFSMSVNGFMNYISDMVIKDYVDVTPEKLAELRIAFPEMTDAQAKKLTHYSLYQNSDRGLVKGVQVNLWANVLPGFDLTANYAYTNAKTKSADVWQVLERSIRNTATVAANYHHVWNKYALNVNLNGRLQSKTYYPSYEDAPGFGVWNLNTTHTFDYLKWAFIEPSIGVDNILNKTDNRIDSDKRRYALYSPGRMLVVGLKVRFK